MDDAAKPPMGATEPAGARRCWKNGSRVPEYLRRVVQASRFGGGTGTSINGPGAQCDPKAARARKSWSGESSAGSFQTQAWDFSLAFSWSRLASGADDSVDARPALTTQQSEQGASFIVLVTAEATSIVRAFSADILTHATTCSRSHERPDAPSHATRAAHAIILRSAFGTR